MKKIILILMFSLVIFTASARITIGGTLRVGAPTYTGEDTKELEMEVLKFGIGGTMDLYLPITSFFNVIPQFGLSYDYLTLKSGSKTTINSWEKVDLNALVQLKLPNGKFKPFINAGPRLSYIIDATGQRGLDDWDIDIDNPIVYGYIAEGGVQFTTATKYEFSLGIGYKQDLTKFNDDLDIYNSKVYIFVGI